MQESCHPLFTAAPEGKDGAPFTVPLRLQRVTAVYTELRNFFLRIDRTIVTKKAAAAVASGL